MKKSLLTALVFCILIVPLFTAANRVSLSDFAVHSDNARYKYMGKGISEMISVELRKSPGIDLIEREKRVQILEEMEISLSDLADTETQVKVGKMLTAGYIIFGEIVDMDKDVLISLRMIDVESGKVVWNEKLTEKLSKYDYISGYFAASILDFLNVEVSKTTVAKAEEKEEKSEEVIIAFSKAVDHYDKKEMDQAKKELSKAKKIDPDSEATDYYLSKLITNTTKFKVMTEQYISYQNPAYLGILRADRFHFGRSWSLSKDIGGDPYFGSPIPGGELTEQDDRLSIGYYFPIGDNLGFGIEYFNFSNQDRIYPPEVGPYHQASSCRDAHGGILSVGYKISDSISTGLCLSSYYKKFRGGDEFYSYWENPEYSLCFAFSPGFLYRNRDESFVYDTRVAYSTEKVNIIDAESFTLGDEVGLPIFWENTFTFAFNKRNTFFVIKQLNDVCIDRTYYYGRLLPAMEHFLFGWLSLRAGIEGSYAVFNDSNNTGFGAMGGITFRVKNWGLDFDLNFTYRRRPSRVVEGEMFNDYIILLSGTLSDLFISRK